MNVLDSDGVPRVMSIAEVLREYLNHRVKVLERRSSYRLQKIIARLEILSGYLIAYLNLDEIIRIIREEDEPKDRLIKKFKLSDVQAESILNMKLRNLRKLDEAEIKSEFEDLTSEKSSLEELLSHDELRWQKIAEEIKSIKDKFGKKTTLGARRTEFTEIDPQEIDISIEARIEKEPITIILSQKGWIRAMKGYQPLDDDFKFKDDDRLLFAIHAQTTDKIVLFDTSGKFFNINACDIPSGRGFGQPLRLMIDVGVNDQIVSMFVYTQGASYLLASNSGYGFIVDDNHLIAQTRQGRRIMNVADKERASFCCQVTGDMVAFIGDNRKILICKLEEVPTIARGRGVCLQKYKDGGLCDVQIFNEKEGFCFNRSGGKTVETNLLNWLGHRAGQGKLAPFGFPKSGKFM